MSSIDVATVFMVKCILCIILNLHSFNDFDGAKNQAKKDLTFHGK